MKIPYLQLNDIYCLYGTVHDPSVSDGDNENQLYLCTPETEISTSHGAIFTAQNL